MTENQGKLLVKSGLYHMGQDANARYILIPVDPAGITYVWNWVTGLWEERQEG